MKYKFCTIRISVTKYMSHLPQSGSEWVVYYILCKCKSDSENNDHD